MSRFTVEISNIMGEAYELQEFARLRDAVNFVWEYTKKDAMRELNYDDSMTFQQDDKIDLLLYCVEDMSGHQPAAPLLIDVRSFLML